MAESNDWILKIISGPHQGAELVLRPGRTVVGAHADCDLVLHDVLVAPQHFALNLDAKGLSVEPLEGRVFCAGHRVSAPSPVPPFAFVTAGTTHVVVGPAAARWPLLSLADVPELEKEPPAEPVTATEAAQPGPGKETVGSVSGKPAPKMPTAEQRRRAWWLAGVGGVMLVIWVVLWLSWGYRPLAAPTLSTRERVERVLNAFPEGRSVQIDEEGGRVTATGYFESDPAQREIAAALREEVPEATQRLWSTPRLLETARGFLAQLGVEVELSAGAAGQLVAHGEMPAPEIWTRTRQLLLQEVPGLLSIKDEVRMASNQAGEGTALREPVPGTVAPPPPTLAPRNPLHDVSVVAMQALGDGQGWLRLSNGQVLFRGAQLADVGRVAEIHPDRAILESGETRCTLLPGLTIADAQKEAALTASR